LPFIVSCHYYTKTVASELAKYKLDLVAVQRVRWVKTGSHPADDYIFIYANETADHHLGTISEVKRIQLINDRMS